MIEVEAPADQTVVDRWIQAGQEHVFRHWDGLDQGERQGLLAQLRRIPLDRVEELIEQFLGEGSREISTLGVGDLEPPTVIPLPTTAGEKAKMALRRELGEAALADGKIAALLVAGGQGTRLGFDGPKGDFPATPITGKSLFRLFAERIRAIDRRHGCRLPLFVMTSSGNHDETVRIFRDAGSFRLDPERIHFFVQAELPAIDSQGKVLMASRSRLFESPDGHGGMVDALAASGGLKRMAELGVEDIYYWQVDNPLARIADPVFLGHHLHEKAQVSTKIVVKREPAERVGVLARSGGKTIVVEYSDLPADLAGAKEPDGRLRFRAGNTAIHLFNRAFLERVAYGDFPLPYHTADKKVPTIDDEGNPVEPTESNGIKFERFIFDLLPHAARTVILETRREGEFSPIKNATGKDSPETARRDMVNLFGRWLERAGIEVARDADGNVEGLLEIGPLYALDEEELLTKVDRNLRFEGRLLLDED